MSLGYDVCGDSWYIDSGASSHMSKERSIFHEYKQFNKPTSITVGNSTKLMAVGKGTIKFLSRIDNDKEI